MKFQLKWFSKEYSFQIREIYIPLLRNIPLLYSVITFVLSGEVEEVLENANLWEQGEGVGEGGGGGHVSANVHVIRFLIKYTSISYL